jgi:hypothetical protein
MLSSSVWHCRDPDHRLLRLNEAPLDRQAAVRQPRALGGLQPHRVRRFRLSTDPAFATKMRDVVGLYLDPPRLLSVDERSQIQALDRT